MKKNETLLVVVGIILFSIFFISVGNTESSDRWVYYGTTEEGNHYFDKSSMTKVSNRIIKVWTKLQPSKDRKGYTISLHEFDCVNKTTKYLRVILYNDQQDILHDVELQNPEIKQIIPESSSEVLLKIVCK